MKRKTFIQALTTVSMTTRLSDLENNLLKENSVKMPVLFLGHGSPMNAIEKNIFTDEIKKIGKSLPKPKAVLCISAHWLTRGTHFTAMQNPRTIHDFGGFPDELFKVQYPAKGDPVLAKDGQALLAPIVSTLDQTWGLDHGAWSVLTHLFPKADIPVVQMSIDYYQAPVYHFELAARLKKLREKGVLIVGSGNIIHNLQMADFSKINRLNYGYDWAQEAQIKFNTYIKNENFSPLFDYKKQSKAFELAIPTPDHYYPLLYTLGLKDQKEEISIFNDTLLAGSLSMTSLLIK